MLSEERIKEQFQLAKIDQSNEKGLEYTKVYFRSDYVGKEMVKSFFAGTICYIVLIALWILKDADTLITRLNTMDYLLFIKQVAGLYLCFMGLYFIATFLVYFFRYQGLRKKTKEYRSHAKKLGEIYEKESNNNDQTARN